MSRSAPTAQNPAQLFLEWKPKKGVVSWYDKEKEENIEIPLPFKFLYLESVYQVGGGKKIGKKPHQEFIGYYSNAVKNLKTDPFTVKSRDGIVTSGLYADIKGDAVKLIVGVYIGFHDADNKLQIGYLKFKGSAMGAWWDFCKKYNVEQGAISIARGEKVESEDEEDKSFYYLPAFTYSTKITDETNEQAIELDRQLQAYLKVKLAENGSGAEPEEEFTGSETKAAAATAGGQGEPEWNPENNQPVEDDDDWTF